MEKYVKVTQIFFYCDFSIWGLNTLPSGELRTLDKFKNDISILELEEFIDLKYFSQEKEFLFQNGEIKGLDFIPGDCFAMVLAVDAVIKQIIFHKCKKISENQVQNKSGKEFFFKPSRDILIL